MNHDLQKLEQLRRSFATTFNRAGEILDTEAAIFACFPHSCNAQTILFAKGLAAQARELVLNACKPLNILPQEVMQPLSDLHGLHFDRQCEREAQQTGASMEAAAAANYALSFRLAGTAAELLQLAEDCLEGKRTMEGREIKRSPLWDK